MSLSRIDGFRIAGVSTCVPPRIIDNAASAEKFGAVEVRKVVAMAGVQFRHAVDPDVTTTDLCFHAAKRLLDELGWAPETITGLILVTQSADYFLPSSSCMVHKWLGLSDQCAAFDVGLGCSGLPYGLYLAATMLRCGGQQRLLLLNGDTPTRFTDPADHATTLLFGDAGSATALEAAPGSNGGWFGLQTDGTGYDGLIIRGGAFRDRTPIDPRDLYLSMDGAAVFNFTIKRVPALIRDSLSFASLNVENIDWFLFHQSNQFIMKHLAKKSGLPLERVPFVLDRFGNTGGPSVALALTQGVPSAARGAARLMMLGYGVGLSWGSAIVDIDASTVLLHSSYSADTPRL